MLPMLSIL